MRFSAAAVFLLASAPPSCQAFVSPSPLQTRSHAPLSSSARRASTAPRKQQQQQQQREEDDRYVTNAMQAHYFSMDDRSSSSGSSSSSSSTTQVGRTSNDYLTDLVHSSRSMQQVRDQERVAAIETRSATAAYLHQYIGQSGAAAIYSKLVENGVQVVNGFSGGAVLPLLDQFHPDNPRHVLPNGTKQKPIRWITNSNESSAGHIAEGYAKSIPIDPKQLPVGVVVATSGPGVTNLITPLQDAMCDGVPMVVLCGQAATVAPKDAFQSAPAVELCRPCTKWSWQIRSAAEVPLVMDYAFYMARHGRPGPVFIDLPKDLQNQIITSELIDSFVETHLEKSPAPLSTTTTESHDAVARLVKRYRSDGSLFQALHLGHSSKGLAFEVAKNAQSGEYHLQPVSQAEPLDLHHADHHPSNHIYQAAPGSVQGKQTIIKEGVLQVGGSLTRELVYTIQRAKKPIIIAGQGCNDCPNELKQFAETLQIPVTTTLHALGCFDERHDLALNMMGMHGHATPNFLVQESDLIICIGSRFDDRITGRMSDFASEAKVAQREGRGGIIHVDIRLTENAKQVEPTFFVHSTGKHFLQTLNKELARNPTIIKPVTQTWLQRKRELQNNFPLFIPEFATRNVVVKDQVTGTPTTTVRRTPMSAQRVVFEMNRQLVESGKIDDAIFTTGVGVHQMIAAQFITWTQPRQMLSSGSLGTMGVSLGYAIGAKLANGKKIVISVDGDGSFNMTFTELKTLMEQGNIPIKILILDNDGQMMVEYWQRLFHDNRLLAVRNAANPDYVKLAGAFGIKALHADHEEELAEKMQEFLFADPDQPVLFHVRIKRTPCLPMVAPGQPLQDMILEDMAVDTDGMEAPS